MKALHCRTLIASAIALASPASATDILVPVSLTGAVATQSSSLNGGAFPASFAIDGNLASFTHTDVPETNATWTLTLPMRTNFDLVRMWNRTDCCGARLQEITVAAFDDAAGANKIFTSPTLNPANILGAPPRIDLNTPALNAQVLKISRAAYDPSTHDGSVLSLAEVQLFDLQSVILPLGTNLTQAGIATMTTSQSSEFGGYPATFAIDGNPGNFTHTASSDQAALWELSFGEDLLLETINLHNRESCCGSRLRDITVSIFDLAGAKVFTSNLLNPENAGYAFPNGPGDIFLDLLGVNAGKPIKGARVQVSRTADFDLSGSGGQGNADEASVLSLGEVTVVGGSVPEPTSVTFLLAAIACVGAKHRRVAGALAARSG
jgi:hypothetical protein